MGLYWPITFFPIENLFPTNETEYIKNQCTVKKLSLYNPSTEKLILVRNLSFQPNIAEPLPLPQKRKEGIWLCHPPTYTHYQASVITINQVTTYHGI